jgi:hypothetical protein
MEQTRADSVAIALQVELSGESAMGGLIYLIGLIVVIMAILSFLGMH